MHCRLTFVVPHICRLVRDGVCRPVFRDTDLLCDTYNTNVKMVTAVESRQLQRVFTHAANVGVGELRAGTLLLEGVMFAALGLEHEPFPWAC